MKCALVICASLASAWLAAAPPEGMALIPAGEYTPLFTKDAKPRRVAAFLLDVEPVTNAQFLEFVRKNPQWRRSQVKEIFADSGYLRPWAADLLHFWFHELREAQWFTSDPAVDAALARRFGRVLAMLATQPAASFLGDLATARAAVLLFDQVPRNLFRDSAQAFAYDPLARAVAKGILAKRWDRGLAKHAKHFIYMPLMHSEAIADQRRCLRCIAGLGDSSVFGFARAHYRMIARFGRFPHRNRLLGRKSTAEEKEAVKAGNDW